MVAAKFPSEPTTSPVKLLSCTDSLQLSVALFQTFTPAQIDTWTNDSGGIVPGFGAATRHDVIMWAAALDGFNNQDHCDDDGLFTVQDDVPLR